jgi:hypothetical protein
VPKVAQICKISGNFGCFLPGNKDSNPCLKDPDFLSPVKKNQRVGSLNPNPWIRNNTTNDIRGRLRELENILVLVQIKEENWTKHKSNLSKHFSYISTDIDHPINAHWFPSLGGGGDNNGYFFHRVRPPIKWRNSDCDGDDNRGKEKKKNHSRMTTATKKLKKKTNGPLLSADCKVCIEQDGGGNANKGMRADDDKGGACFLRVRLPNNARNNALKVDVRRPREEGKKKIMLTSALNRFGHKLLKDGENYVKGPRKDKGRKKKRKTRVPGRTRLLPSSRIGIPRSTTLTGTRRGEETTRRRQRRRKRQRRRRQMVPFLLRTSKCASK